jgi:hypothetical protein
MSAFLSSHLGPTGLFIWTTVLQTAGCASMALIIGRGRLIREQLMNSGYSTPNR